MKCVLNKYREMARHINKKIKIQKDTDWLSYQNEKIIGIPRAVAEQGEKEFLQSIEKQLPAEEKDLINIIPDFMWSFLHEVGHIEKGTIYHDSLIRGFANMLGRLGLYRIANAIYFNLKEEVTATKWAVDYAISHKDLVGKYSWELCKTYKRYYKSMNLED